MITEFKIEYNDDIYYSIEIWNALLNTFLIIKIREFRKVNNIFEKFFYFGRICKIKDGEIRWFKADYDRVLSINQINKMIKKYIEYMVFV